MTFSCLSSDTTEILELRLLSPAHVQGSLHLPLQPFRPNHNSVSPSTSPVRTQLSPEVSRQSSHNLHQCSSSPPLSTRTPQSPNPVNPLNHQPLSVAPQFKRIPNPQWHNIHQISPSTPISAPSTPFPSPSPSSPHPPTSSRIHRLLIPTFDRLVLGMRHVRSKPGNRHQAPFFYRRSSYRRKRCERLIRTRHYRGPRKGFHQGVVLPRKHLTPRPKRNGVSAREFLNHTSATISFVAEVGE